MNTESAVTIDESRRLIELERKIQRGLDTFVEVGEALMEIRDKRLYRVEGEKVTFEAYCRDRWKMDRHYAHRLITASQISEMLPIGNKPQSESQVRPLTKLEPEQQATAWDRALEIADGEQPTAKEVEQAVTEVLEPGKAFNHRSLGTGENEWYTPQEYIEAARQVLGEIDLDPATSMKAQEQIRASNAFTSEDDGLSKQWKGRVWLNPPYSQPEIRLFCEKLVSEFVQGNVTEAILLTHNYTDTAWFHISESRAALICFTRGRIRFVNPLGKECAPTQGQAFFYYGSNQGKFREVFQQFGFVR